MELSYENNVNDSIALFRHHLTTNPDFKKRRNLKLYVTPLIIFTGITMFAIANKDPYIVIGGIVFALIAYLWYWFAYPPLLPQGSEGNHSEDKSTILLSSYSNDFH